MKYHDVQLLLFGVCLCTCKAYHACCMSSKSAMVIEIISRQTSKLNRTRASVV